MEIKRFLIIGAFCEKGTMDDVVAFFRDVLGAKLSPERSHLLQYGIRGQDAWLGTKEPFDIEIHESINDELPMGRQVSKYAPRFQILALEVANLDEAIAELRAKGVRISDKLKMYDPAVGEYYEAMIHPKSSFGFVIDLIEHPHGRPEGVEYWWNEC